MNRTARHLSIALLTPTFLILTAAQVQAQAQPEPRGIYTDSAVYEPGDTIGVHASLPDPLTVSFQLVRHGESDQVVAETEPVAVESQQTRIGSFIEVGGLDLSGRDEFTIEGWWYPKVVGGDVVMVAGQGDFGEGAGIFVTDDGHLAGYVGVEGSPSAVEVVHDELLLIDEWHHIALRYDDPELALYLDGERVGTASAGDAVAPTDHPFRIGAGPDAPGAMTGIVDGRVDAWTVWPTALSGSQIQERRQQALSEPNPTPPPNAVDFHLGFHSSTGKPVDRALSRNPIKVFNYGNPHMVGVHEEGLSMRLNHDQIVDTGWDQTVEIPIPDDAKSGLYSVVVEDHSFPERQFPQIIVRPSRATPGTEVAVVAPVNTWVAYNPWPGHHFEIPPEHQQHFPQRQRSPDDPVLHVTGNNSAYRMMGDGISPAYFQGWLRPNPRASIYTIGEHEFNLAARLTFDTVRWLEEEGIPYDMYTDWDVDDGFIDARDYNVMFFHGHSEYWTRSAIDNIHQFADQGGSFLFMSANVMYWHVAHSDDHLVQETRKWPRFVLPTSHGPNDRVTSIGNEEAGLWEYIGVCDDSLGTPTMLHGAIFHLLVGGHPSTFGRWEVTLADHWLWPDDVYLGAHVGKSRFEDTYTVGHEMDTFDPQRPPAGLAPGADVTILAEGTHFPRLDIADPARDLSFRPDCSYIEQVAEDRWAYESDRYEFVPGDLRSGSIMMYPHEGGGHVLTIGSTAAAWALGHDHATSTMAERFLQCFGYGQGCHDDSYVPSPSPGGGGQVSDPEEGDSSHDNGCTTAPIGGLSLFFALFIALAARRRTD